MKVVKAFLAGLAIGIFFAPHSGKKTRRKISDAIKGCKDSAKDYLADAADTVESKAHATKEAIQNL